MFGLFSSKPKVSESLITRTVNACMGSSPKGKSYVMQCIGVYRNNPSGVNENALIEVVIRLGSRKEVVV